MATLFEARPRCAIARPAVSGNIVTSIAHCVARIYVTLDGPPRVTPPVPYAPEATSPTAALWILHAR